MNINIEPVLWNRCDIENDWENIVDETNDNIDILINEKNKEIESLINYKNKINNILKDIKNIENTNNLWENKISTLKNLIINSSKIILSNKDNRDKINKY
jgi:hypothetical protein